MAIRWRDRRNTQGNQWVNVIFSFSLMAAGSWKGSCRCQLDSQLSQFNPCFNKKKHLEIRSLLYSGIIWICLSELSSPTRRRCLNIKLPVVPGRKKWNVEETKWLEEGVKLYGVGNWAKILSKYNFVGRTSVNLKDRWRTLQKNKWCWKVLDASQS